jgi:hypothetical protein
VLVPERPGQRRHNRSVLPLLAVALLSVILPRVRTSPAHSSGSGGSKRWVGVAVVVILAVACLAATVFIRRYDSRRPRIDDDALFSQQFAVMLDANGPSALTPIPNLEDYPPFDVPQPTFGLSLSDGDPWTGSVGLIVLGDSNDPPSYRIDIERPFSVRVLLPEDARLAPTAHRYMADTACASWSANDKVGMAEPDVPTNDDVATAITCDIPAVGVVDYVRIEFPFTWPHPPARNAGFARTRAIVSLAPGWEVGQPPSFVEWPVTVTFKLQPSEILVNSFPNPDGGTLDERSWTLTSGDIDLLIERPDERQFVQPAIDLTLLLGGTLLGLAFGFFAPRRARPD